MHNKYKNIGSIEDCVVEECGELLQAISKAKRFGYKNHHPDRPNKTNAEELIYEILDLQIRLDQLHNYILSKGIFKC